MNEPTREEMLKAIERLCIKTEDLLRELRQVAEDRNNLEIENALLHRACYAPLEH